MKKAKSVEQQIELLNSRGVLVSDKEKAKEVYFMSLKYQDDPFWFVSPIVVRQSFIDEFDIKVYRSESFKRNVQIKRHHQNHPSDKYAPAWKTIEFMTFGSVLKLYKSIDNMDDKRTIAKHFGVGKVSVFESFMSTIHTLRNKKCPWCGNVRLDPSGWH